MFPHIRRKEPAGSKLRLDSSLGKGILAELQTHFDDEVNDLKEQGYSDQEARRIAAKSLGSLPLVVNELNEVHNSSNWLETLLAALPHALVALIFALHQYSNTAWLMIVVLCTVGISIYGWQHNKPNWLYSWLGYALMPLVVVGVFLLYQAFQPETLLPSWLAWILMLVYFPILIWLFVHVLVQVLRRDWLLGSLMTLPIPVIAGWFMTVSWRRPENMEEQSLLTSLEPWIAVSFLTLAGIVVLFTRMQHRFLRVGLLLASGITCLVLLTLSSGGQIGLANLVVLGLMVLSLLGPALLEQKIGRNEIQSWDCLLEHDHR